MCKVSLAPVTSAVSPERGHDRHSQPEPSKMGTWGGSAPQNGTAGDSESGGQHT